MLISTPHSIVAGPVFRLLLDHYPRATQASYRLLSCSIPSGVASFQACITVVMGAMNRPAVFYSATCLL